MRAGLVVLAAEVQQALVVAEVPELALPQQTLLARATYSKYRDIPPLRQVG